MSPVQVVGTATLPPAPPSGRGPALPGLGATYRNSSRCSRFSHSWWTGSAHSSCPCPWRICGACSSFPPPRPPRLVAGAAQHHRVLVLAEAAAGGRQRRCRGGGNAPAPAIDEEDAEHLSRPRALDHCDVLDIMQQGIRSSIFGLTRGQATAAARHPTEDPAKRLYKRHRLAIETERQEAVD